MVLTVTALLLYRLAGKQVTVVRAAADDLARTCQLETLGDRLLGFLHECFMEKRKIKARGSSYVKGEKSYFEKK